MCSPIPTWSPGTPRTGHAGSAARLAAIDAAIREEESKGLQETGFYRDLLTTRINDVRKMAEEEAKVKEEAAKEAADDDAKENAYSPPLSTYSGPGGLRQDPGHAAEWLAGARTCRKSGSQSARVVGV